MDQNQVIQAINCVLSGQNIKDAEQWLMSNLTNEGYTIQLLMISDGRNYSFEQRQFALSEFNRAILDHWNPKYGRKELSQADKIKIKSSILDAIIRNDDIPILHKLFQDIMFNLVTLEYPQNWSEFPGQLFSRLQNAQNLNELNGCLLAAHQLYKVHQFFVFENRSQTMDQLQIQGIPVISNFLNSLVQNYSMESAKIIKYILKVYHSCICLEISSYLSQPDLIQQWMIFLKCIYDAPLPQEVIAHIESAANDKEIQSRESHPMIKNKKWIGRILHQFISKHANKVYSKTNYNNHIPQLFQEKYAVHFLESFVKTLYNINTQYVSHHDITLSLKYVYYALKYATTFQKLHLILDKLLFEVCFPLLAYTDADTRLYQENPTEFVRREDDINSQGYNVRNTVIDLIEQMCSYKDSNNTLYLFKIVNFAYQCLLNKVNYANNQPLTDQFKDGILFCFGRLKEMIMKNDVLINQLEPMLSQFVQPEFLNPNPILKVRACWVFGKYNEIEYKDINNIKNAVNGVCICIQDSKNMPVQLTAGIALDCLLTQEQAREMLKPNLQQVLEIYLTMLNGVEWDGLIEALDGIVEYFQNDIAPYAINLIKNLIESFNQFMDIGNQQTNQDLNNNNNNGDQNNNQEDDDEDDDANNLGAQKCLEAIAKVLDSPLPDNLIIELENMLIPVIERIFLEKKNDLLDEGLNVLNLLIYKSKNNISEKIWFFYPLMIYILVGFPSNIQNQSFNFSQSQIQLLQKVKTAWGADYISLFLTPIKNYISRGQQQFLQRNDFFNYNCLDLLMNAIDKVYQECEEVEKTSVSTLYISLLENNRGRIDNKVSYIINSCLQRLNNELIKEKDKRIKSLVVLNIQIISICIWYNAALAIKVLEDANQTQYYFQNFYENACNYKTDFEKSRILYGLGSLLTLQNNIPQSISGGMPAVIKWMVKLTTEILEVREIEEECDSDDSDIPEDDVEAEKSFQNTLKKLEVINKKNEQLRQENPEDDDEDDDDYNVEKDIESGSYAFKYDSILEQDDEILFLEKTLQFLHINNNAFYNYVLGCLDQNEQLTLSQNIQKANQQMQEFLQNQQQQNSQQQQQSQNMNMNQQKLSMQQN